MKTVIKKLTKQYFLIAEDGDYGAIQNIGQGDMIFIIADTPPIGKERGYVLKPLDTITPVWGEGDVYARQANNLPVQIAVTQTVHNFHIVVNAPAEPIYTAVGGTVTVENQGGGQYKLFSDDIITAFKFDFSVLIYTCHVINGKDLNDIVQFLLSQTELTEFIWDGACNVTNMSMAWYNCSNLKSFPWIDTSKVVNMVTAWFNCSNLKSFPWIDTGNITNLTGAWKDCSALTSFPAIDTSNVTKLGAFTIFEVDGAWQNCSNLKSFPWIDTSKVVEMASCWSGCLLLESFPAIDTSEVTDMNQTWYENKELTLFPAIDTSKVIGMNNTWGLCSNLESFPAINTSNVIEMINTWQSCNKFVSFPLINTENVNLFSALKDCISLIDVPSFNLSNAEQINFSGLRSIKSLPEFDYSSCINLDEGFSGNIEMKCISGTLDFTNITQNLDSAFENCPKLIAPAATGTPVRDGDDALVGIWTNPNLCGAIKFEMLITSPSIPTLKNVIGGAISIQDNGDGTFSAISTANIIHFEMDANKIDITKLRIIKGDTISSLGDDYNSATFIGLENLIEFEWNGACNVTKMSNAWRQCKKLTSFPAIDTSKVTLLDNAWLSCESLTSFPLIDTKKAMSMSGTWSSCSALTSFPAIDTSNVKSMLGTWSYCSALESFPAIDTSNVTNFENTWSNCPKLKCLSELNTISAIDLSHTFDLPLEQPPPTGTSVRDGVNALAGGTWTNPNPCPEP